MLNFFQALFNKRQLPNFIIIGAQKCGTTALHNYLAKHPQLAAPQKELRFFNSDNKYSFGKDYYNKYLTDVLTTSRNICFDTSPGYFSNPKSAERIYRHNKNIKLILLLRNPSERAFSAWNMYLPRFEMNENWFKDWLVDFSTDRILIRRNIECFSNFSHVIEEELDFLRRYDPDKYVLEAPILNHGFYWTNISRYYRYFSRNQILIVETKMLYNTPVAMLEKIELFLGLPAHKWNQENLSPVFEGAYGDRYFSTKDRQTLNQIYSNENNLLGENTGIWF
jgi:hypothetical protein